MKKTFIAICLLGSIAPLTHAHYSTPMVKNHAVSIQTMEEGFLLPLQKRNKENNNTADNPIPKSLILIPEVTIQGNTLRFITPCDGYELRLVQDEEICYSTEINDDTLTLPTTLHGVYELQIVSDNYIFYTEITL